MGGPGSGRWRRPVRRPIAENCLVLDVNRLSRDGVLLPHWVGSLRWSSPWNDETLATIGLRVSRSQAGQLVLRLVYRLNDITTVDSTICIDTTRPHLGGQRFWFMCPRIANGIPCRRRAVKLYLRNGYFACRHCHDLRYRSSQEAHKEERPFRLSFAKVFNS
jgi:hypothetical protein